VGFLKVLSRIFISWSNKLRGRYVRKTLAHLRGIVIRKIEYVGVHCVDIVTCYGSQGRGAMFAGCF
jgi:hypothetical protein